MDRWETFKEKIGQLLMEKSGCQYPRETEKNKKVSYYLTRSFNVQIILIYMYIN